MPSPFLESYSLSSYTGSSYKVDFSIPNNCSFTTTGSNGTYSIIIRLNTGETVAETGTNPNTHVFNSYQNSLTVSFDLPNSGSPKKPILVVQN